MFPLLRLLSIDNKSNSTTNSLSNQNLSNSIDSLPIFPNNDEIIHYLERSNNSILQFILTQIKESPQLAFILIILAVFLGTMVFRFSLYLFTQNKKQLYVSKKLWKAALSPKFVWLGFLLGIIVAIDTLKLPISLNAFIKRIALSILLWILYHITQRIISVYGRGVLIFRTRGSRIKFFRNKNLFIVFTRMVHFSWLVLFITTFLGIWGVELAPILAGLGIVGIVVGLALQDSLSHVFGGISLMLDETYSEGDYVILENGNEGIIFQIGYRSTKLRTFDEEIIIIPNGVLSKMIITNLSQPVKRIRVTAHYHTYASEANPEFVKELLLLATKQTPVVLNYPEPYVFLMKPYGNQYHFRLNYYISSPMNRLSQSDHVHQEVIRMFQQHNIRFAFEIDKGTYISSGAPDFSIHTEEANS